MATAGMNWLLIYRHPKRRTLHDSLSGSTAVRFKPEAVIRAAMAAAPETEERVEREARERQEGEAAESSRFCGVLCKLLITWQLRP